ncbi:MULTISPECIES: SMI1/KNR4 family protein [Bacillus]|uniref:SMI1/KNR4 family protein n=1 Tax=Bacillus TaxID=1386 RepID=UPI00122F4C2C|nr:MULTISPECIES: SMI1/KNR4 family protein [Bacillus]KAA2397401.1 SMI1/KNR4 family protein [Bacillus cereus]MCU5554496.1 SMI1/KNR4 family protein [Bacillus cereus]MDA1810939.1 SMI1/KNR4 family protein [Bacillus cereus]MDH8000873.1 SMI1/KNR4 family protein [Bacillus cereus]MDU2391295.1 SMI1/KNR4 family protein [Bacillus sp. (in: firmicutes)]
MNIKWIMSKPLGNEEAVVRFENMLEIVLPNDYKLCVANYNAGRPRPNVFDTAQRKELVAKALLSFDQTNVENIWTTYENLKNQLPKQIVPFMSDQFGNYICFDYRTSNEPAVVFWDQELSHQNIEKGIIYIANSFSEFIGGLYELN